MRGYPFTVSAVAALFPLLELATDLFEARLPIERAGCHICRRRTRCATSVTSRDDPGRALQNAQWSVVWCLNILVSCRGTRFAESVNEIASTSQTRM
jgi:hypothetical protein